MDSPIEEYLDDLLRHTRTDARTARRLLDEAADHLHALAAELRDAGWSGFDAECEAVRRFGPPAPIARSALRRSVPALAIETLRGALFLGGCGLVAIGISGLVALVMNVAAGRSFVGAYSVFPEPGAAASVAETADDAVVLRAIAGVIGLVVLLAFLAWRRSAARAPMLPAGLIDALGAAAFAAATVALAVASADQAVQNGAAGVGFPLSGAIVALPAAVFFCVRAARALVATAA
jgi:hypothetical protein